MSHIFSSTSPPEAPRQSRWRRLASPALWRRLVTVLFLAYIGALLLVVALFRLVGEAWWVTTAGLYLPRVIFGLPLPLLAFALAMVRARRLLWLLPVPVAIVLFPLMGLHLRLVAGAEAAGPRLRVLSFNIASAGGAVRVAAAVARAAPDLVLLQEWDGRMADPLFLALPGYHHHVAGQFGVWSRYPLLEIYQPARIPMPSGPERAARFVRYRVATPLGELLVINMHPVSPRSGLEDFRDNTLLEPLRKRRVSRAEAIATLRSNADVRWRQAEAVLEAARGADAPVIIAGDTNLPGLSRIFASTLSAFADGFSEAGRGFGYTFPAHWPWMRIDRILASAPLRFTKFVVLPDRGSDHLAVLAELAR